MKTQKISFTSKLNIKIIDGATKKAEAIAEIDGENVSFEFLPGTIVHNSASLDVAKKHNLIKSEKDLNSTGYQYLSITSKKKNAILMQSSHEYNQMEGSQEVAHFGIHLTPPQKAKLMPIIEKVKKPYHANCDVELKEASDHLHLSYHKNTLPRRLKILYKARDFVRKISLPNFAQVKAALSSNVAYRA